MAEIPKLTTRNATGAGIREGTMHKAAGDYARSGLPGQQPTGENMGPSGLFGDPKEGILRGIPVDRDRRASLSGDAYSNRGSVSSISVSPRLSKQGGGSAQNLIMTGHQGDTNGRGYATSIQAEAQAGTIHSPAEMYSSAKNMESLTFNPVSRQMADNPSSVSDAFRQFNTGAPGGSEAINNSDNPAAGRQSGAEVPSNITPDQHAAYVKDIEERAKKVDPKDVKKTVSRFLGGMQTQIGVDSAEDFFAHAQAVHDFLAPEPELQRQFGYSLNTTNPDASMSLVGTTKNFENEYRPIQDRNVEKNNSKAKVSAEDKVDIKAAVRDLEEGKHIGAGAGMRRQDFSPSPIHEISPPAARKMRLEGAGDTPNAAGKAATPAAAPAPAAPAPAATTPPSAKIPQAVDASAPAAAAKSGAQETPYNKSSETVNPRPKPAVQLDQMDPAKAPANINNAAPQTGSQAARSMPSGGASAAGAATPAPTTGPKAGGNPPRPTTPSPKNQTAAEMAENERKAAQAAYEKLSKSDNPAHRAMAEKAKARAEGGRVIKDGQDVGTAAEQAGSTIPRVSDSPAQAAQKVASTPSVPAAASQQTGAAAARSAPSGGQTGSAAARGSAASVSDEVDNAFNNVTGNGSESRKALGTGRPSDRKALGTGAEAARSAPSSAPAPSSSPTGELARRESGTGGLAPRRGEAATADAQARQARRAAGGSGRPGPGGAGAFPSSPAAGAAPAGSGAATASRAAAGGGVGGGAAATAGGGGAAGAAGGTAARGGAGAAAGRATRGSRTNGMLRGMAYNSSLIDRELDLTTRGFVAGIGSIANDLGLNRRISAYGADGTPSSFIDTFFGTTIRGGTGYAHPLMDDAGRVAWTTASDIGAATAGWGKHIEDSFQSSTGIMKHLTGVRRALYNGIGGGADGNINKMLTRLGGAGSLVAPVLMGVTAIADFRQGYKKGGVFGGVASAGKGIVAGWITNKIVAAALLNPVTALVAGGAIAAAAYATYKIFDVRNQGNNYLRQRQMQGPSWKTGPSAGMNSSMGNTIRQRSMHAMENSRFNAMRSMGNESYMITAPKSRYANSTSIHSTAPMLSY